MTVTLTREAETVLRRTSQRTGQEPDLIVSRLLAEVLTQQEQDLLVEVAAIQEGLDAIGQGRVRPFKDHMARHRQRFPSMTTA